MYKLALFFLLTCSLHTLPAADLHLTAETESLASVQGCVNAVSGDFFFTETGLATSSVSPIHYTTSYDSGHAFPSPRGYGIGAYFPTVIFDLFINKKRERADLLAWEREGFNVPLQGHFIHHAIRFSVHSDLFKLGYTNYSESGISGRNNVKNRQITYRGFGKHYTWGTFEVVEGCGTKRIYQPDREGNDLIWRLSSEIRPNGHKVLYEYQGNGMDSVFPRKLKVTNADESITYGTLDFISQPDGYSVEASNGNRVDYTTAPFGIPYVEEVPRIGLVTLMKKHLQLTAMDSSQGVKTHYTLSTVGKEELRKISHISKPDNRFLNISYRNPDAKVTALHAPVGTDASPIQVASFQYGDKYTEVYDAHGIKTVYRYPTNKVSAVEKYAKNGSLYSTKHFVWGESGPQQGHLLARGLSKGSKEFVTYTIGTYDERGNIIKEELFGNLTGHGPDTFTIGFDSRPVKLIEVPPKPARKPKKKKRYVPGPPVESVETHYVYSQDGFNLLLEEHRLDSISLFHNYLPNTNLPISKFRTYCGRIISREFHEYQDGLLVKTIADDGSSPSSDNLADVHVRTFQKITRRNNSPAIGCPDSVIEGFLDLSSGYEVQLKRTLYHYDSRERVIQEDIYDRDNTFSYSLFYAYDDKGNIVRKTDAIGRVTNYEYDENRNCVGETLLGSGVNIRHHYDCANRLIRTDEYHRDSSILTTSYSYDYLGNRVAVVDYFGNETRYVYDEFGRQTQIIHPACQGANGDVYRTTQSKEYDLFDNVVKEIDGLGNTTCTKYNIRNQPIEITHADGSKERYEYNLNSSVRTKWEPSGIYHHYDYDGHLRHTRTATYAPDGTFLHVTINEYAGSNLVKITDPMGHATEYRYDGAGRKVEEIKPAGTRTTYAYDSLGRLQETTHWIDDRNFVRTIQEFDFLDRPIAMHSVDQNDVTQRKELYEYDLRGNQTVVVVAIDETSTSQTTTEYDTRNRPTSILDACGHVTTIHNFERYPNPIGGYLLSITTTDPLATQTIEIYDAVGRPWIYEKRNPQGQIISHQKISYDPAGRKTRQIDIAYAKGSERECYTIDWTLDAMGHPLFVTESGKDGSRKTTAYTYDAVGRLKTLTKPDGVVLHHDYDALGRLVKLSSSDHTIGYIYHYDPNDNLLHVEDLTHNTETRRTYDEQNRMIGEELANGFTFGYTYDGLDRPKEVTLPNQCIVQYFYEGKNCARIAKCDQHKNIVYQHTYDSHDLRGIPQEATLPCQSTISFLHDALARPTKIASRHWNESVPEGGWDGAGNLLNFSIEDPFGATSYSYQYDDHYQIIAEDGDHPHTYSYDSIHNRLSKDGLDITLNGLNQVKSDSHTTYEHDPNGNLIAKQNEEYQERYSYDALNRLMKAERLGSWEVFYTYDSFGRRLSQTCNDTQINYLYQGHCEIGTYCNNTLQQLRILGRGHGSDIGAAIAIELNNKLYVPIHDHRGNVCCLLDGATGIPEETSRYSAFGESLSLGDPSGNPWRYASKRLDTPTGLYHFGKRDYDPHLGRWLTPDPAGFVDGPNLYAYVHNRPLTYIDPDGCFAESLYQPIVNLWENPRLHGSLQAAAGFTELSIGSALTFSTSGLAAPLGCALIAHGADHLTAGMRTVITGDHYETATTQLLQKTGLSEQNASFVDSGISMLATMGGTAALKTVQAALPRFNSSLKVALKESHVEKKFKSFTKGNSRDNLKELTGMNPPRDIHAHHVFPQKYRDIFLEKGLDVHDPKYMTWWHKDPHQATARAYNDEWLEFFRGEPDLSQILEKGRQMMQKHGIEVNY